MTSMRRRYVAEVAARFYNGRNLVAERKAIKLVAASLLSMHKRPAVTDSDRRLVAMIFWKSPMVLF